MYYSIHLRPTCAESERTWKMTSVQNRKCESCDEATPKYRCPRCERLSCSLPCVKKHKADHDCDGVRDKTAYVPVKEFTERHLLSDYRFLEEVDRKVDNANRDVQAHKRTNNKFMNLLRTKARLSGATLKLLPTGFTRRRQNTTQFNRKLQMMNWRVEWSFPQAEAFYSDKWVPEDTVLKTALQKYVDPEKANAVIRHRLKAYCSREISNMHLLMKVEERRANSIRYEELQADMTLKENLRGKVVVEFPTILVVLAEQIHKYKLVGEEDTPVEESSDSSSEDESDTDTSSSSGSSESSQSDEENLSSHGDGNSADQSDQQLSKESTDVTTNQENSPVTSENKMDESLAGQSDKLPKDSVESTDVITSQENDPVCLENKMDEVHGNKSLADQSEKQPPKDSVESTDVVTNPATL
ncbi:box C/D snoRNA protein 1-like [Branchiostoma lanceolatum]|uniref:box C/D snoRNA protein 1-like n=1 Tax=Branchiostoma lanceolatum TaxID=7740 RepID=UPI003456767D